MRPSGEVLRLQTAARSQQVVECRIEVYRPARSKIHAMDDSARHVGPRRLEARIAALRPGLDVLALPACILDRDLRYRYVNAAYARVLGRPQPTSSAARPTRCSASAPADGRREPAAARARGRDRRLRPRHPRGPQRRAAGCARTTCRCTAPSDVHRRARRAGRHPAPEGHRARARRSASASSQLDHRERRRADVLHRPRLALPLHQPARPRLACPRRTRDTSIGRRIDEVFEPEVIAVIRPAHRGARSRGEKVTYERAGRGCRTAASAGCACTCVPDIGDDGEVRGLYTIVIDVDDDHRLREALERAGSAAALLRREHPRPDRLRRPRFPLPLRQQVFLRMRGQPRAVVGRHVADVLGPELSRSTSSPSSSA